MDGSPWIIATLNSAGGDVASAMAIGHLFREKAVQTHVVKDDVCSSACVFIFAGGVSRTMSSHAYLGLHRPTNSDYQKVALLDRAEAEKQYQKVIVATRSYFSEMGLPSRVAELILNTPNEKIIFLDRLEAKRELITGDDPAYAEWSRARAKKRYGAAQLESLEATIACMGNRYNDDKIRQKCGQQSLMNPPVNR